MALKLFDSTRELKEWKVEKWNEQLDNQSDLYDYFSSQTELDQRIFFKSIILNPYIPVVPFLKQVQFIIELLHPWNEEALFGGARGGGKSETVLMLALQFVKYSQWSVGIFRRTYRDLKNPGAVMNRMEKWMNVPVLEAEGIKPHWSSVDKLYTFPSGAVVTFANLKNKGDELKYQGAEFHRELFDEAVLFPEYQLTYLVGSARKLEGDPLPVNYVYTGNPGGLSHEYMKENFVNGPGLFIPSTYLDNPHLDHVKYDKNMQRISRNNPILYQQWRFGNWDATPLGKMFQRAWLSKRTYTTINERIVDACMFWDLAKTKAEDPVTDTNDDGPDWTAGALLLKAESNFGYLENVYRFREYPDEAQELLFDHAELYRKKIRDLYGIEMKLRIEQEGGASPGWLMTYLSREFAGWNFDGKGVHKDKVSRAEVMVHFMKYGNMKMKEDPTWNTDFLNELGAFPTKKVHDDQVDALSGAYGVLYNPMDDGVEVVEGEPILGS
jgi:predicted phage terminase large subunit-like protein